MNDLRSDILAHALETPTVEVCGLVIAAGNKFRLIRGRNIAAKPREQFDLDPEAWLEVGDDESVIGVYHSHPFGTAAPSLADKTMCEATGVAFHIVGVPRQDYVCIQPHGFRAPYEGRPYVHTIHDCYAIMRDWYNWEYDIQLPDPKRDDFWWEKGQTLYLDLYESYGFIRLSDAQPVKGDIFLIQANSRTPNHSAIYVGDNTILHHVQGRLSCTSPWGGMWQKHTTHHLRHKLRMSPNG